MCKGNAQETYVGVLEAAEALSTTHPKVLMLIKQGALNGVMEGGEWRIATSSIEAVKINGIAPAPPPACKTSCTSSGCGCK